MLRYYLFTFNLIYIHYVFCCIINFCYRLSQLKINELTRSMAYLINENDPDDYTKDTFDTATGPFGVTGFSNDGKESGGTIA